MVTSSGRKLRPDPLRPLNIPRPIRVTIGRSGAPDRVQVAKQMKPVAALRDSWHVEDRWWTDQPVSRIYYELELEGGEVLTLFHDRLGNQWYEQRVR